MSFPSIKFSESPVSGGKYGVVAKSKLSRQARQPERGHSEKGKPSIDKAGDGASPNF